MLCRLKYVFFILAFCGNLGLPAFAQDIFVPEAASESREELLRRITQHHAIHGLAIAPDGVLAGASDLVRVWDGINGTSLISLVGLYPEDFQATAFSPDGTSIVGLSEGGEMNAWSIGPLKFKASFVDRAQYLKTGEARAHSGKATALAFSPDGSMLVSAAESSPPLKVWNADTGDLIRPLQPDGIDQVHAVAFSPDGELLAYGADGTVTLLHTSDWSLARKMTVPAKVLALAFSPDGDLLLTGGSDMTARLWKTATGDALAVLSGHQGQVRSVAFSPDGDLMATASMDMTVKVWTVDGNLKTTLPHSRPVMAVAFTDSGSEVVSGAADNTIRLFRLPDWKLSQRLIASQDEPSNAVLFEKSQPLPATGSEEALPFSRLSMPQTNPKQASGSAARELATVGSQILRSIASGQNAYLESLFADEHFTVDGSASAAPGQVSLRDREGLIARLFDSNRLSSIIRAFASARPAGAPELDLQRFKSLRDILRAVPDSKVEILDRAVKGGGDDAATIVIHWSQDPSLFGLREYPRFAVVRRDGSWEITDVTAPLDISIPTRFAVRQQRLKQLKPVVDQLIRRMLGDEVFESAASFDGKVVQKIVRDRQAGLAFEIEFAKASGQWWDVDLDTAEIVFRWDGDPSNYMLPDYPRVILRRDNGSWRIRP